MIFFLNYKNWVCTWLSLVQRLKSLVRVEIIGNFFSRWDETDLKNAQNEQKRQTKNAQRQETIITICKQKKG